MAAHAGPPAVLDMIREGVRGERNDRHSPAFAADCADAARRLETVHLRHAQIHQDKIETLVLHCVNRRGTAIHTDHVVTGSAQE
jgi:hypothetical protein